MPKFKNDKGEAVKAEQWLGFGKTDYIPGVIYTYYGNAVAGSLGPFHSAYAYTKDANGTIGMTTVKVGDWIIDRGTDDIYMVISSVVPDGEFRYEYKPEEKAK